MVEELVLRLLNSLWMCKSLTVIVLSSHLNMFSIYKRDTLMHNMINLTQSLTSAIVVRYRSGY